MNVADQPVTAVVPGEPTGESGPARPQSGPVSWQAGARGGCWEVTRHADVSAALRATDVFSSEHGTTEPLYPGGDPAAGSMLAVTDPPRHTELRRVVNHALEQRFTHDLTARVRSSVKRLLAHALTGEIEDLELDLAHRLAVETLIDLLAVPAADRTRLAELSTLAFADDLVACANRRAGQALRAEANMEIIEYFTGLARPAGRRPGADFASALVAGGLTARQAAHNCFNVLAGGTSTTRSAVAGFLRMLAENAELLRSLRTRPGITPLAVQEIIRWTSPVSHVMRVCKTDTVLGGQQVLEGQRLTMWISVANHDDTVFNEPQTVRLDRFPNPHLGFGGGGHACAGMQIARLELRELVGQLIQIPCEVMWHVNMGTKTRVKLRYR
jgi:cytochrome P450